MFSRLANLFKGFFSLFISGVERRNPAGAGDIGGDAGERDAEAGRDVVRRTHRERALVLLVGENPQASDGGKAVAEMHNDMAGTQTVTDITKDGSNLVLKFAGNFQGNPYDAAVTLTPDGTDKLKVTFDVNAGQFTMSGTGIKK